MAFKSAASILQIILLVHFNVCLSTDFMNGRRDLFGPYPRIPDKKLLENELEYAKEFKKFYKAPKEIFIR